MNRHASQNNLAMTVVLISGTMLFVTLLMGYSIYRTSVPVWPPEGVNRVPLGFPLLSTFTILLSSWFSYQVKAGVLRENLKEARKNLDTTILLGVLFMWIQTLFWAQMRNSGIFAHTGIFSSIMYGFTWIHAAHVVLGLGALLWLRFKLKLTTPHLWQKSLNVEKFWHFLGIIWLIMFLTLFVL